MSTAETKWRLAWLGGPVIGVANGALRDATYQRKLGEQAGHQVSTAIAIAAFAAYFDALERRWPLPSSAAAARVGVFWLVLTVAFEFGLGRERGLSWRDAGADYDLTKGRTWPLVLLWLAVGPAVIRARHTP